MKSRIAGSPVKLIVYPGAHHVFDAPLPGRRYFGHWLEYNAAATRKRMMLAFARCAALRLQSLVDPAGPFAAEF